jgi:TolB-like protein/class 3 adenylate cyclase/Flp pilus assembly protein TadD
MGARVAVASKRIDRKLAAIVAADVAGYSRLMAADEEGTLARLKGHRAALIDPKIAEHGGRIIKTTGDGMLVEFASVVDALRCLVEIQRGMLERNADIPAEKRIDFRVGINVGDVIVDCDDIYGDGVNVAARLESLAEPGGILVAGVVRDQVRDKLSFSFDDLGDQSVKNIPRPVRAYRVRLNDDGPPPLPKRAARVGMGGRRIAAIVAAALLLTVVAGGGAWYSAGGLKSAATVAQQSIALPTLPEPGKPLPHLSIVVLPFANLSGDATQDYFADGVTESLTTDLSRISGSFVIARNTAFTFKGKNVDAKEIGKQLGVRYVLEGSVQRGSTHVRVNAQLIDSENGGHLWADRFDKPLGDLFVLQDEIVAALASQLNAELISDEARRAEHAPKADSMDLYFQGMARLNQGFNPEDLAQARGFFERALALDPDNLDALLQEVNVDTNLAFWQANSKDEKAIYATAEATVTRVLSLAPNNAHAHFRMALILVDTNRRAEAMSELERALALDPNFAWAHGLIGYAKMLDGRAEETEADEKEALRLSPHDRDAYWWLMFIANSKVLLGAYEEAVPWYRRSLELNRTWWMPHLYFAAALELLGRRDEARAEAQTGLAFIPKFTIRTWAMAAGQSDNPVFQRQWERLLQAMHKTGVPEK